MSSERIGDWIQTYSLKQFWPLDPRPEDVCIEDIAHALSMMCRFTGHVHHFYSVAEHSVRVSIEAERLARQGYLERSEAPWETYVATVARWGLLHDASEAYLVDVARPVKRLPEMAAYVRAEYAVQMAICRHFGIGEIEPGEVKVADRALCYTEARDLFPGVHPAWKWQAEPLPERIEPLTPYAAKALFLARFAEVFPAAK